MVCIFEVKVFPKGQLNNGGSIIVLLLFRVVKPECAAI